MLDRESIRALSTIDPELEALLSKHPLPQAAATLEERRATAAKNLKAAAANPPPDVSQKRIDIPTRNGGNSSSYLVAPTDMSKSSKHPLVVLFFGGGFIANGCEQMIPIARGLAKLFGAVTVCGEYRLAPEHAFPAQSQDGYDIVEWAAKNAESIGANPSDGFVVGGVSAGANISGVVAQIAKDEGLSPALTGQWLSVPLFFAKETVPKGYEELWMAREQNAEAPILPEAAIQGMMMALRPDWHSPWMNPMFAESGQEGLPPAYFQVDGLDPLRDDGLIYEDILSKAGVKTKIDIYPGWPHAHFAFFPPSLSGVKKATGDIGKGFAWLLHQECDLAEIEKALKLPNAG